MADTTQPRCNAIPQTVAEAAVRSLRHEVGDLLQTVYASVALLQHRLPENWLTERRILSDMRKRGEECRVLLDLVHDLVCPIELNCDEINWADILDPLIATTAKHHPQLKVTKHWETSPAIVGDPQRVEQISRLVLAEMCADAHGSVDLALSASPNGTEVRLTVARDGDAAQNSQLAKYFELGSTDVDGPSGIGMVLVQRIVQMHGGHITVDAPPRYGLRFTVSLPTVGPKRNSVG